MLPTEGPGEPWEGILLLWLETLRALSTELLVGGTENGPMVGGPWGMRLPWKGVFPSQG